MRSIFTVLVSILSAAALWAAYEAALRKLRRSGLRGLPLPPGPKGRFLKGNVELLHTARPEDVFMKWGKEFDTDIVHTRVLGQNIICLNSAQAASDLVDRRSANYGDRPRFVLFEEMGWGPTLTFLPSTCPQFRLHRSMFQTSFSNSAIKAYQSIQLDEAKKAVKAILESPDDWEGIALEMSTSIIYQIAYGREVTTGTRIKAAGDGRFLELAKQAADVTTTGGFPGLNMVDLVPSIRFFPSFLARRFAPELVHARQSRAVIESIAREPWKACIGDIDGGVKNEKSFVGRFWERMKVENQMQSGENGVKEAPLTEDDLKGAAAAVLIAGGSTTWSTVLACFLFLTLFPEQQIKLQKELDDHLKADKASGLRLANFYDLDSLPYLCGFVNEVLRMMPLNPLIIPHANTSEDEYKGYRIPARSTVLVNAKAINMDPNTYKRPELFRPERYMGDRPEPAPMGNFGFGRRKCPGRELALQGVRVCLAVMMGVLEVRGKGGGNHVGVSVGLGGHPTPFECEMRVRRPEMASILVQELGA